MLATVLFTDIVGSTERIATMGDRAWHQLIEDHHAVVRAMIRTLPGQRGGHRGRWVLRDVRRASARREVRWAIIEGVKPLGLEIRAGVHTGEVETIAGKIGGMGVVIGSRIGAKAQGSEVLASQTVKDLPLVQASSSRT